MSESDFKDAVICLRWLIIAMVVMCIFGALVGCTKTNYVYLESSYIDSLSAVSGKQYSRLQQMISEMSHTNITTKETIIKDSIIMVMNDVGEVISREVIRTAEKNVNQQEIISVIQTKIDSILDVKFQHIYNLIENDKQIPVPIEKELNAWEKVKQDYFGYLCGIILILLAWKFRKPVLRLARKYI